MLAAIALLLAQSPADQHRLTWELQVDGSVTAFRRVGDLAVAARCRPGRVIRCVVASESTPRHFTVRRFDLERLPAFTIGLLGEGPGYGCDWIAATQSVREVVGSGRTDVPPVAEQFTQAGRATWTPDAVRSHGGRWFSCVPTLAKLRRSGLTAATPTALPAPDQ